MNIRRFLLMLLSVVVASVVLTGCHSSRNAGGGRSENMQQSGGGKSKDYTGRVYDPLGRDLVDEAQRWLGTRYAYGGHSRKGTDCSGLVMEVYQTVCNLKIPRSTREQMHYCTKVARNKMQIGDLVFFSSGKKGKSVSHVGMYIGGGEMIHASSSRGVVVSSFDSGYWGDRYLSSGRVDAALKSWASTSRGKAAIAKGRDGGKNKKNKQVTPPAMPADGAKQPAVYDTPALPAADMASAHSVEKPQSAAKSETVVSVDLLDLIINQKVDSIFSSQYMD